MRGAARIPAFLRVKPVRVATIDTGARSRDFHRGLIHSEMSNGENDKCERGTCRLLNLNRLYKELDDGAGAAVTSPIRPPGAHLYHTRQAFAGAMGWPVLQLKAFENSGMFTSTPFVRKRSGECGSVVAIKRSSSGRHCEHQFCA